MAALLYTRLAVSLGLGLAIAFMIASCSGLTPAPREPNGPGVSHEKVLVASSILPLADFVRQVGGEYVTVVNLVPAGASPHTYELTPAQVEQVSKARLLVLNGVGLEYWAGKLVGSAGNPNLIVVDTSEGIPILEGDIHDDDGSERHQESEVDHKDRSPGGNPHIWLDPRNAIAQVSHIREALIRADPERADQYRENANRYISELQALDREIASEVSNWRDRDFIAFHPAWAYFAKRYGLVQAAVIEETPGREPSPAEVARIIETARRISARAIFAEPQFSPKAAQAIARESGAAVLFLDPLGSSLSDPSYLKMMRYNLAEMAKALR